MEQPIFNAERESQNYLFYKSYQNDAGRFQFHSQIELYFVDEGEMEAWINDQHCILQAGEMSVSLSFDGHAYRTPEYSRSSVLIIPPYLCEEFITATKGKKSTAPFIVDKAAVREIKACYERIKEPHRNAVERLGYIYVILGIVMDHIFPEGAGDAHDLSVSARLLLYINENFKNGITPAQIAAHFGYSQSYLSRYFKSCFQITLIKYLTIIKLKNAIMLMHEQRHSVTYCALESGFASMRTFYNAFLKEFGCSPKEYMDAHTA